MKTFLLALALTAGLSAAAQNIDAKVQKSEVFKIGNKYSLLLSATADEKGNTIAAFRSAKGYLFQHYVRRLKAQRVLII